MSSNISPNSQYSASFLNSATNEAIALPCSRIKFEPLSDHRQTWTLMSLDFFNQLFKSEICYFIWRDQTANETICPRSTHAQEDCPPF